MAFAPYLCHSVLGHDRDKLRSQRNAGISSSLKFVNVVYITTARYNLEVFWCDTLADGRRVLSAHPSVMCDSAQHILYMCLGILGTLVYTLGLPVVVGLSQFYMHRHRLHTDRNWILMFGWSYCAFEAHTFYYGFLTIIRRMLFVLISQVAREPRWQSTFSILLLGLMVCVHLKQEPYKDYCHDVLELFLLITLCAFAVKNTPTHVSKYKSEHMSV